MSVGVRDFPSRPGAASAALGLVVRMSLTMVAMALGLAAPATALAQGSLQDLVGSYDVTERVVEGEWCANVEAESKAFEKFVVTDVKDDKITIEGAEGAPFELAFDSSTRSFRYDIEQQGYKMSLSGQFVRGRDKVALALIMDWRPQIDCFAHMSGTKPARALEESDAKPTDYEPNDWGWLENDTVLIMIALLLALTAAGIAYTRRTGMPDETPPEPDVSTAFSQPADNLIAPEDAYQTDDTMPLKVWESLSGVPESWLTGAPWKWNDGSRVSLYTAEDGTKRVQSSNGQRGLWGRVNDGSIYVSWSTQPITIEKLTVSNDRKSLEGVSFEVMHPDDPEYDATKGHRKHVRNVKNTRLPPVQ